MVLGAHERVGNTRSFELHVASADTSFVLQRSDIHDASMAKWKPHRMQHGLFGCHCSVMGLIDVGLATATLVVVGDISGCKRSII